MADDTFLTEGDDVFILSADQNAWGTIRALGGNDTITLERGGNVLGGAGNDTIIDLTGGNYSAAVYWDSPGPIHVNLATGVAQDGWGGTDTLVDIHNVHTSGRNGDVVIGSSADDSTWVNGFWQAGDAWVDLGDGVDEVTLHGQLGDYALTVSADGRQMTLSRNGFTAHLDHIERVSFWQDSQNSTYAVGDLITLSDVGPATLVSDHANAWGGGAGPVRLSYSFMSAAPAEGGVALGTGFVAPSAAYQDAVRSILSDLSAACGLSFVETADAQGVQLRFAASEQSDTKGYAFNAAVTNGAQAGQVWMDVDSVADLRPGTEGWQALLHEIGHALGLDHPPESDSSAEVVLLDRWQSNAYTVMSEHVASNGLWQTWYGPLDIDALQSLYGVVSTRVNLANSHYAWSDAVGQALRQVDDAAGLDVLDFSALSRGVYVDLRPGHFSSAGLDVQDGSAVNNLYLSEGSWIEAVVGTDSDDVLVGNDLDNIFVLGAGNDWVQGGAGLNTCRLDGQRADYTLDQSLAGQLVVEGVDGASGAKDLIDVQRLVFADQALALDMADKGAAVAKILGAVFGADAVSNLMFAGIGLNLMDQGYSREALMDLALDVRLGVGYRVSDEVNLFFNTLVGRDATAAELRTFSGLVDSGAHTSNSLAWFAADFVWNTEAIGLDELMLTGLAYAPAAPAWF